MITSAIKKYFWVPVLAYLIINPTPAIAAASMLAATGESRFVRELQCASLAAIFAITFIQPIEVVKTRMQLTKAGSSDSNYFVLINQMINKEGPGSLYKGIKASWISEGVNDGCMLGLYAPIKVMMGIGAVGAGS